MKVCILTTSYPLRRGDISGMFVQEQARHLTGHGAQVSVIAPHHHGAPLREDLKGITVRRFRYFLPETLQKLCYGSGMPNNVRQFPWTRLQLPLLLVCFTLKALWHARRCDVIHAHWSIAGLAGSIPAWVWRRPIVLNMHMATIREYTWIEKYLLEHVDYLVTNSSYTLEHILRAAKPRAFRIVSPGVDTVKFRRQAPGNEALQALPEKARGRPIIFTLGRLVEWKGHRHLIEAMPLLTQEPMPHLLIGGEGVLRNELGRLVREKGLVERVTFLNHIPGNLIASYYCLAEVYAQPSIIDRDGTTEGLGVTILEAMSCGTPCVASRVGGIPDIITDGENGFLVEPGDPSAIASRISNLLENETLRKEMGRQGRRTVLEKFSWESKAQELLDIYYNLKRNSGGV